MERQVGAFYRHFAGEAQDPNVRELCLLLADEEMRHFRMIEALLSKWKPQPPNKSDLEVMDADGKLRSLLFASPGPDATNREILEFAMNVEDKMIKFYRRYADEFTNGWKIKKLQLIEAEKIQHYMKLQNILAEM